MGRLALEIETSRQTGELRAALADRLRGEVRDDAYTEVRGTYPEMNKPSGEQSAAQGSVTTSLTGLGSG